MTHPPGRRGHLGIALALLAFAQLIIALDYNIVFVALPEIGTQLGFGEQTLQWVVSAYAVAFGGFLLLGGRAADLLGRRRMFLLALGLYGIASLAGGLASSPGLLVAARAVQGIGGALLFPATLSLLTTTFAEGPERNRALAIWGGAGASGLTLGSLLGGALTDAWGWEAVFFVNVPLAAVVIAGALAFLPRDEARVRVRAFDLPGALTATAGISLVVVALVQGPDTGWTSGTVLGAGAAGLALVGLFLAIEARSRDALMPLRLLANRSPRSAMAITFVFMGTLGALPYFLTLHFQAVRGMEPLESGLAFLLPSLAIATGTQLGERLVRRAPLWSVVTGGFVVAAAGTLLLSVTMTADASYAALVPGLAVMGVGQGVVWTAMWIAAAEGVRREEQGVASGMASTAQQVGGAVGLALLIVIANAGLDGAAGEAARQATSDGLRSATLVAAAAMVLGVLAGLALRRPANATADGLVPAVANDRVS